MTTIFHGLYQSMSNFGKKQHYCNAPRELISEIVLSFPECDMDWFSCQGKCHKIVLNLPGKSSSLHYHKGESSSEL